MDDTEVGPIKEIVPFYYPPPLPVQPQNEGISYGWIKNEDDVKIDVESQAQEKTPSTSKANSNLNSTIHPSLAQLSKVSSITVQKKDDNETNGNFYDVLVSEDANPCNSCSSYLAEEKLTFFKKYFAGQQRSFEIILSDTTSNRPAIIIERPKDGCRLFCGSPFYGGDAFVKLAEREKLIGKISLGLNIGTPCLSLINGEGEILALIKGPRLRNRIWCHSSTRAEFTVKDWKEQKTLATMYLDETEDKKIGLQFFNKDLSPQNKALLLGALFFINISFSGFSKPCYWKKGWLITELLVLGVIILFLKLKFM